MKGVVPAEIAMIVSKNPVNLDPLEDSFSLGEANMKLEGFNPAADEIYLSLKADVLAGKIDFDQAVEAAALLVSAPR
jgi:hypothetical protein